MILFYCKTRLKCWFVIESSCEFEISYRYTSDSSGSFSFEPASFDFFIVTSLAAAAVEG